jgi:hypothetical protein
MLLPLASCVAIYLESTRVKPLAELRADKERQEQGRDRMKRREAAQKVKQAPEQIKDLPIIGLPISGDLPQWKVKEWLTYPAELLNRHAVIIGGSGTGKTEFLLRVAYLVAKVLKWKVFYIDAKGDYEVANRFMATMAHAGVTQASMFPDFAYNGWKGDATAILNRLMAIEDYSEPYYRAIAKTVPAGTAYPYARVPIRRCKELGWEPLPSSPGWGSPRSRGGYLYPRGAGSRPR